MAIIDVLLRANRAQKILFLADRKALRDQAYNDGFKVFYLRILLGESWNFEAWLQEL